MLLHITSHPCPRCQTKNLRLLNSRLGTGPVLTGSVYCPNCGFQGTLKTKTTLKTATITPSFATKSATNSKARLQAIRKSLLKDGPPLNDDRWSNKSKKAKVKKSVKKASKKIVKKSKVKATRKSKVNRKH